MGRWSIKVNPPSSRWMPWCSITGAAGSGTAKPGGAGSSKLLSGAGTTRPCRRGLHSVGGDLSLRWMLEQEAFHFNERPHGLDMPRCFRRIPRSACDTPASVQPTW